MTPRHIQQAEYQLASMRDALVEIEAATTLPDVENAWGDFLRASGTLYNKLHAGAKLDNKAYPWFGKKIAEREADPVLRYVHHARNSDEHGILELYAYESSGLVGTGSGTVDFTGRQFTGSGSEVMQAIAEASGGLLKVKKSKTRYSLQTVTNKRHKTFCKPPNYGFGTFNHRTPFVERVARDALAQIETVLEEAKGFLAGTSK